MTRKSSSQGKNETSINTERLERLKTFFVQWYVDHGRRFPWRDPGTAPFAILIAEMLLRQTNARAIEHVWRSFLQRFPTPAHVCAASFSEIYETVAILGLGQQRSTALKECCCTLVAKHQGKIPRSIESLVQIPHIGLYTAHAIACFGYGQRVPVVDVNVLRVLARITGEKFGQDNRRAQRAWDIAWMILPKRRVREHNYGLLDFAAQICTSHNPKHAECPLKNICASYTPPDF